MTLRRAITAVRRSPRDCMVMAALVATVATAGAETAKSSLEMVRLGLTYSMFGDINENDAKASIKALATAISRERSLPADPEPHLIQGTNDAMAAIQSRVVNSIGLTTPELWLLRRDVQFDGFAIETNADDPTDLYIVLVPAASSAHALPDLQGRKLTMLRGPRMSLAPIWLDIALAKRGLPSTTKFFGEISTSAKPSKVVLPVFFDQTDACIVNRRTYETMVELNPQIQRQVRTIAVSPPYIASLFAMVRGFSITFRDRALREFSALDQSVSGQQVMTIFQTQHVRPYPESVLGASYDLLDEHARLCPSANAVLVHDLRTNPKKLAAK